jgi:hypothetical protein
MRQRSESHKQALRHLAAARYYLPIVLEPAPGASSTDESYIEYLHHTEYELALDELAAVGIHNSGYAEEGLFWRELELAALEIGLPDRAAEFGRRAGEAERTAESQEE